MSALWKGIRRFPIFAKVALTCSSLVRSQASNDAPGRSAARASARPASTSKMTTDAPAAVKTREVASPIPLAPPVTIARRPFNLKGSLIHNELYPQMNLLNLFDLTLIERKNEI